MNKHSQGLISAQELLRMRFRKGGFILGLSSYKGLHPYQIFAEVTDLKDWLKTYDNLNFDPKEERNTEVFMDFVTNSGRPVVMLIPNKFLSHFEADVTAKEFLWLLKRPEAMKNVIFVFGAYSMVTGELKSLLKKRSKDYVLADDLIREMLQQHRR